MQEKKLIPISELGLAEDGKIYINKDYNDVYLIENHANIIIEANAHIHLLDTTKAKSVIVEAYKDSVVEYTILNSSNSKREFKIQGEINITEIVLDKTNENLSISLEFENARSSVKCLCISSNAKNVFKQYICHNCKNTISNISNVAVAMNASEIIFDTTGKVEKNMSLSRCQQLSRGIVMDDVSTITAKPILLIDEYDCFANHGASIGKMSDEDLFYLMSRGLTKKEAFLLILQGIIQPFISSIEIEELKNKLTEEVSNLIEK